MARSVIFAGHAVTAHRQTWSKGWMYRYAVDGYGDDLHLVEAYTALLNIGASMNEARDVLRLARENA